MFGCGPMVNYNRVYDFSKDFLLYLWKIPICQTVPNCHIVLLLIDQKEISIDTALENSTNWFVLFICFLRKWWKNPKIWTACNCIQSDIKKSTEWEIKIYTYIYYIFTYIYNSFDVSNSKCKKISQFSDKTSDVTLIYRHWDTSTCSSKSLDVATS